MKRIINALICIMTMSMPSLYAMEIIELEDVSKVSIRCYESLAEDIFNDIEEQKQALYESMALVPMNYNTMLTSASLHQMSQYFYALSDDSKRIAINDMPAYLFKSKNVSLLLSAMMLLPPEVIQYVCLHILDGEEDAAKQFYALPFDRYYQIKIGLADDAKPVGPLYLKPEQVCELALLKMHGKPRYLPLSFVSFDDNKEISLLDETTKDLYLGGKELFILPEGDGYILCTTNNLYSIVLASGMGLCVFGVGSGIGAAVGALSSGVGSVLCNPAFVLVNGVASCVLGTSASYGCSCITGNGVHRYQ